MSTQTERLTEKLENLAKKMLSYSGFDGQYISGDWRPGRAHRRLKDTDPYTGDVVTDITLGDLSDLDEAYRSAKLVQPTWASALPAERADVLHQCADLMAKRREEIVDWLTRESGSTRIKANIEWEMLHAITIEAASFPHRAAGRLLPIDEPGKESRAYRQPLGVIGVISPWNFPIYLAQRSVGPAIALGNTVVLKPSQDTPVTGGLLLAKLFEEAGLPPGVLNVVIGASSEIGDAFVKHPTPALISFTGSTAVGKHVAELAVSGARIKRLALELGGNTPFVVLDDADLDQAVPAAVMSRFLHQGQICMSSNRILVDASIHGAFAERFTAHVKTLKTGNPRDPDTVIGPVINSKQLENMLKHINETRSAGAKQLVGGDPNGLVLPPHVFSEVTNDMPIARNETFGPIAPIIRVNGEEEALRVANDTEYGLSSAVFSRDQGRGVRFALALEAGMTHVNGVSVDDTPTGPFGGAKNSGIGRFGGDWIIDEFTVPHWVTVQHSPRPYPF